MALLLSATQHNRLAAAYGKAAHDPSLPDLKRAEYARKRVWFESLAKTAAKQAAQRGDPTIH